MDKQLHFLYGTIHYGHCSRNPLSGPLPGPLPGPLLFIYTYIYILIITTNFNVLSILKIKSTFLVILCI